MRERGGEREKVGRKEKECKLTVLFFLYLIIMSNEKNNNVKHKTAEHESVRLICFVSRRRPKPKSSTPALFETAVKSFVPVSLKAFIKFSGIPHKPKPPTVTVHPFGMSATASAAFSHTLPDDGPLVANVRVVWCGAVVAKYR